MFWHLLLFTFTLYLPLHPLKTIINFAVRFQIKKLKRKRNKRKPSADQNLQTYLNYPNYKPT